MHFGYMRVSTDEQKHDLQLDALLAAGVPLDNIVSDTYSRSKFDRPGLTRLLDKLRPGDTLVVWKLDRLGGKLRELIDLIDGFNKKKVHFISITNHIDTSTAVGELMFHIIAAFAQHERSQLIERVNAGLAAARARGRKGGRKPHPAAKVKAALALYDSQSLTVAEIKEQTGIAPATLYRYLAKRTAAKATAVSSKPASASAKRLKPTR